MCLLFSLTLKLNGLFFQWKLKEGTQQMVSKYISFTVFSTLSQIFFFLPAEKCIHFGTWNSAGILYISVSSLRCFKREYEGRFSARNLNLHALCTEICLSSCRAFSGVGLRPLDCRDCEFEFRPGNGYLSLVVVLC